MPKQAAARSITTHLPRELPPPIREMIEAAARTHLAAYEHLLAFLDELDGDSDLEDGGDDEDSLGSGDDREDDPADDEPSLGSQDAMWVNTNQEYWAFGSLDDTEDQHDGREPSLGAGNPNFPATGVFSLDPDIQARWGMDQSKWQEGVADLDLEQDHDGREPDEDEESAHQPALMAEQSQI